MRKEAGDYEVPKAMEKRILKKKRKPVHENLLIIDTC